MKIKLDENLGNRIKQISLMDHEDVSTVREQDLQGKPDSIIYQICKKEKRILVTLDHDFGNLLRFSLRGIEGIAIMELPVPATYEDLKILSTRLSKELKKRSIREILWSVSKNRIRIRPAIDICL